MMVRTAVLDFSRSTRRMRPGAIALRKIVARYICGRLVRVDGSMLKPLGMRRGTGAAASAWTLVRPS